MLMRTCFCSVCARVWETSDREKTAHHCAWPEERERRRANTLQTSINESDWNLNKQSLQHVAIEERNPVSVRNRTEHRRAGRTSIAWTKFNSGKQISTWKLYWSIRHEQSCNGFSSARVIDDQWEKNSQARSSSWLDACCSFFFSINDSDSFSCETLFPPIATSREEKNYISSPAYERGLLVCRTTSLKAISRF